MAMNNELKSLAMLAKQRLKGADYTTQKPTYYNKSNNYFMKNLESIKKLSAHCEFVVINDKEDLVFLKKVHSILKSGEEILNPIGRLVDKEYYKTLNSQQKQQYVLNLCDKYNNVKNSYFKYEVISM